MKKVEDNQEEKKQLEEQTEKVQAEVTKTEETLPAVAEEKAELELTELSADEDVASEPVNKALSTEVENKEIAESSEEAEAAEAEEEVDEAELKKKKSVKKKAVASEVMDWIRTICIGVIAGVLLVVFVIQRDNVYGDSMNPTLESGDVLFTQKISTYFKTFSRGDIVVLNGKGMEGYSKKEYLIKRVIGLPGETVKIADGNVYIKPMGHSDYYILQENYLEEGVKTTMMDYGTAHGYNEIKLGDNEYFCLGDNRPVSNDSRNLGPFTADRIVAVAVFRAFPFNKIRTF
ncbi:MAG: signal peptidase I [Ruminococcaceae bacterium]|nr:signal peptidase I [Oscillospiraceae bacterium]